VPGDGGGGEWGGGPQHLENHPKSECPCIGSFKHAVMFVVDTDIDIDIDTDIDIDIDIDIYIDIDTDTDACIHKSGKMADPE